MNIKALAMGGAAALALVTTGLTANAAVVDKPTFKVGGLVVVWGSDGSADSNVVSDFYLLSNTADAAGTDLIGGADVDGTADTVVTGDLAAISVGSGTNPAGADGVLNASETLAAFGVDADTDVNGVSNTSFAGRFYVASNTAFKIKATATTDASANTLGDMGLENILFDMSMDLTGTANDALAFGAAAQAPDGGVSGFATDVADLADMTADKTVFTGTQRTAASVGNLAAQSVRFNTNYSLDADEDGTADSNFDLSVGTGTLEAEVTYTIFTP